MTFSVNNQNRFHQVQQVETNKADGVKDAGDVSGAGGKSLVMYEKEVRNLSYTPSTPDLEEARQDGWDRQDKYKSVMMKLFAARMSIGGSSIMCDMYVLSQLMLKLCQEIRKQNRQARSSLNKAIQANIQAQASIQRSAAFRGALVGGIVCGMQAVGMVVAAGVQSKGFNQNAKTNEFGGVDMAKEQMGMTEALGDENAANVQLKTVEKATSRVLGEEGVQQHRMANFDGVEGRKAGLMNEAQTQASQELNARQMEFDNEYNAALGEKNKAFAELQGASPEQKPAARANYNEACKKLEYFEAKKDFAQAGGTEAAKTNVANKLQAAQAKVTEIENAEVGEGKAYPTQEEKEAALASAKNEVKMAAFEKSAVNKRADLVRQVEGELAHNAFKNLMKDYARELGIEVDNFPDGADGSMNPNLEKAIKHNEALADVADYKLKYETARTEYLKQTEGLESKAEGVTKETVKAAEMNYKKAAANYKLARAKQVKLSTDLKMGGKTYRGTREMAVAAYKEAQKGVEGSLVSNDANKLMTAGMLAQQIWNVMGQEGQQIVQAYKETMLAGVTELSGEEKILEDEKDQTKDLFDEFKQGIDAAIGLMKGVYSTESSSIDAIIRS